MVLNSTAIACASVYDNVMTGAARQLLTLMIATTDELPEIRSELQKIMARSAQEFVDSKAAEIFQSDAEERDAEYGDYLHEQMINDQELHHL